MRFIVLSLYLMLALTSAQHAFGKEGGGEKPEGGGEKSGGSGADKEWAKRRTKLNVYEAKLVETKKTLQGMIRVKNDGGQATDEKGNPINVIDKIASEHRRFITLTKEYNTERSELKYRFPEEGALIERKYLPMREMTLDEIEHDMSLDAELTKTKMKIDNKYAPFVGPKAKKTYQRWDEPESTLKNIKEKNHPHAVEQPEERLRLKK